MRDAVGNFLLGAALIRGLSGCSDTQRPPSTTVPNGTNNSNDEMESDLKLVDDYLVKWDRFARGEKALVPFIRDNRETFETALAGMLQAKDPRAPARLVFYVVVQVGGSISLDSQLGKASTNLLGADFPIITTKKGRAYFAGDLYFWWLDNRDNCPAFPLFEEWGQREFSQKVVAMYKSAREQKNDRTKR